MIRRASRPDQTFWPLHRGGLVFKRRRWPSFHPAPTLRDLDRRTQSAAAVLAKDGTLTGSLKVPHAAADINLTADLRAGHVRCSAEIAAPSQGRQQTKVRWLLRQSSSAPADLNVEATYAYQRAPGPSVPVGDLRKKPDLLIPDKSKDIKSFQLTLSARAGSKRGAGRGSFTDSALDLVEQFYTAVVQGIKPWTEPAPTVQSDGTKGSSPDQIRR